MLASLCASVSNYVPGLDVPTRFAQKIRRRMQLPGKQARGFPFGFGRSSRSDNWRDPGSESVLRCQCTSFAYLRSLIAQIERAPRVSQHKPHLC
jgi:hypothetical protein